MSQERIETNRSKSVFSGVPTATSGVEKTVQVAKQSVDKVRVVHGANDGYFAVAGKDVGDVRKSLKEAFNLPGDAVAQIDGKDISDDHVLVPGETLEFFKASGTKG